MVAHKLTQPLKWHGGKHYLASRIVALCPPHLHYVEPHFGGGSVLLAKGPEGVSEVANDLNGPLTNFWRCLASPESFEEFRRRVEATPFCEAVWRQAAEKMERPCTAPDMICLGCAWAFFVHCRQSLAGRMKGFTGITKTRVRRGMNNEVSAWLTAVEGLPAVHARLKRVLILNRDALEVIRGQDGPDTLFYCDPPYLHETRATTGEYGQYEMTEEDHRELWRTLARCEGKWLLSGYPSPLYEQMAATYGDVRRVDIDCPNAASGAKQKRRMTESLWMNF